MPVLLSTPLLKIPLLAGNALFTYYGMTPPRRPPPPKEQNRFAVPDLMTRTTQLQLAATAASKYVLCGAALTEAVVLLAHHLPPPYADRILPLLLLPAARAHGAAAALQLTPASAAGLVLGTVGGIIRVWCHRTLGKFFTWQMAVRDDHELVTRGPYAVVRHPSYTGWLLMIAGNFLLLASPHSFFVESGLWGTVAGRVAALASFAYCMFSSVNLVGRVAKEDTVLRKEFGEKWEAWARDTPYRLVPFVY
uniref:Protein-S-isoprenylcysteine O-methyltransferase n=1 Tax=Ganoderma boninense TaxID=34458 RepID=A0A5K1JWK3_9APHY|nr:C-24(28) sterol reductase [Ganoderma boninense]